MVAAIIKNNFSGHMETPDPRTLMTLVKRKLGVEALANLGRGLWVHLPP